MFVHGIQRIFCNQTATDAGLVSRNRHRKTVFTQARDGIDNCRLSESIHPVF